MNQLMCLLMYFCNLQVSFYDLPVSSMACYKIFNLAYPYGYLQVLLLNKLVERFFQVHGKGERRNDQAGEELLEE